MRSRASGGTCGASMAAASALTMSSLRRRAIWVHRAMSTERSSIGGRASARTTAPASVGSASSRSQASTSRISARWKNAASPTSRCGMARSSSATLTAWPSWVISGTRIATLPGATPVTAQQALDVDGHRLGLGALVGTAPQLAHAPRRAGARGRGQFLAQRGLRGLPDPRRAALRALQHHHAGVAGLKAAHPTRRGAAVAPQPGVRVPGDRHRATRRDLHRQRGRCQVELLGIVDEQVVKAPCQVRLSAGQAQGAHDEVAVVARPGLGQHPLVRAIDLGELALALGVRGLVIEPLRPCEVRLGGDQLGLETVDPAHEPAEQGVGAPAEVVVTQRELVDALDHHRQPVAGREHRLERVSAGAGRAQHQAGQRGRGEHEQLVIAAPQAGLEPRAQSRGARRGGHEHPDALRSAPLRDEPTEARLQHPGLAGSGSAENEYPSIGVGGDRALIGEQAVERALGGGAVGEQVQAVIGRTA